MKSIKSISIIILPVVFMYLCAAFVKWSFDASSFTPQDRAAILSMGLLIGFGIVTFPKQKQNQ